MFDRTLVLWGSTPVEEGQEAGVGKGRHRAAIQPQGQRWPTPRGLPELDQPCGAVRVGLHPSTSTSHWVGVAGAGRGGAGGAGERAGPWTRQHSAAEASPEGPAKQKLSAHRSLSWANRPLLARGPGWHFTGPPQGVKKGAL